MDDTFPIRAFKGVPVLVIFVIDLIVAFVIGTTIYPDHLRIVIFSIMMSSIFIYSSLDLFRKPLVVIFLLFYIAVHVAICLFAPVDDSYYGAVLIPIALLDYLVFAYSTYFVWKLG